MQLEPSQALEKPVVEEAEINLHDVWINGGNLQCLTLVPDRINISAKGTAININLISAKSKYR